MPFSCAKAVCATFCHHIAGALIPIFGPKFPTECVHPKDPDHGRMCIGPAVVAQATLEAESFRRLYADQASLAVSNSPRQLRQRRHNDFHDQMRGPYSSSSPYKSRQHFRGAELPDSPCHTDTEEYDGISGPETVLRDVDLRGVNQSRYPHTPVPTLRAFQRAAPTSAGWTTSKPQNQHSWYGPSDRQVSQEAQAQDHQHDLANPFLSALTHLSEHTPQPSPSQPRRYLPAAQPRHCNTSAAQLLLAGSQYIASAAPPTPVMSPKRPRGAFGSADADYDCDVDERYVGNSLSESFAGQGARNSEGEYQLHRHQYSRSDMQLPPLGVSVATTVAERNAALLLMNLSVPDGRDGISTAEHGKKHTEKDAGESLQRASVLDRGVTVFQASQDDRPTKRQRRTISI